MSAQVVSVSGMTCQHCVTAVTTELSGIPGVTDVSIELKPEGVSLVTVLADAEVSADALGDAIGEAGYTMEGATETS